MVKEFGNINTQLLEFNPGNCGQKLREERKGAQDFICSLQQDIQTGAAGNQPNCAETNCQIHNIN